MNWKHALLGLLSALTSMFAHAQSGDFILTHHSPKHSEIDNINFDLTADQNGIICIANRFGLIRYDGVEWEFYPTESSAISLCVSKDNTIFIGGIGEFGKMDFINNEYDYVPIMESDTLTDHFLQTFEVNGTIYFLSNRNLFGYDTSKDQVELIAKDNFMNGYVLDGQLYVNNELGKVIHVVGFKIETYNPENLAWGVVRSSPKGLNEIGISLDGDIYQWQNDQPVVHPQNDKILEAGISASNLVWVNDTLAAFSTLESGVFFLNTNDPTYFELTDYHSGLPDNEIYDMYADNDGGVWVAHEFGLTRIAPLYPAYSYTSFPGLEGNLIEAQRLHGDLWVNTSLGVYYFAQDTSYQSKVYKERVVTPGKKKASPPPKTQMQKPSNAPVNQQEEEQIEEEEAEEEDTKSKRGFMKGLFRKRNRTESAEQPEEKQGSFKKSVDQIETVGQSVVTNNLLDIDENVKYIRRVERIVTGVTHQFHHIQGTDGKFKQLLEAADKILATSHNGIYEINKKEAQLVINEPVRFAFVVPKTNLLLISTETGFLKTYLLRNNIWLETSRQHFKDAILNVHLDKNGHLWLAGTSHIYRGAFQNNQFAIEEGYEINNRFFDELSIWERGDNLYFINSLGYFRLDKQTDRIVVDKTLAEELGVPHHHLHNEQGRVWIFNGKIWLLLLPDGNIQEFTYLGVYPDLKYISYDETLGKYWLVTQDNQLLAYVDNESNEQIDTYKLFVKRIVGKYGERKFQKNIDFKYDENFLSIQLLKPDYMGILNPEYQYKLVGLNQNWSSWTHANLIDYSYIPPGNYELLVRMRNSFGEIEESSLLTFTVETPYWQRPWFYALQVFILVGMIAITSRLNESNMRNRLIKHGLSILTLVVIIQFLNALIHMYINIESTPVADFLIDIATALVVFPLEWFLKKLLLGRSVKQLATKPLDELITK
jgi:ligand-binding sensor domain-containing protein